jgi:hypothetical protein
MAQVKQAHDMECNWKKCTANVMCRGCKDTWHAKDLNYDGYCDGCARAHAQEQEHLDRADEYDSRRCGFESPHPRWDEHQHRDETPRRAAMIVAGYDGGVRIELDEIEALDLANFLHQFYGGADSVVDHLSAKLDDVMQIER